jgi:hypothetical protein
MAKKGAKNAQVFKEGWIVTLAIPAKMRQSTEPKRLPVRILGINRNTHTLMSRFGRIKGGFQSGQLNKVESETLGLDIPLGWPETGPKILLTQAVQLFNSRGTIASIQKAGRDIEADQAKANKAVVAALDTVAKWVAKLPLGARVIVSPVPASPVHAESSVLGSASPEIEAIPRRQSQRGTKRQAVQIDPVEAQIIGEIEAIQAPEPVVERASKRARRNRG